MTGDAKKGPLALQGSALLSPAARLVEVWQAGNLDDTPLFFWMTILLCGVNGRLCLGNEVPAIWYWVCCSQISIYFSLDHKQQPIHVLSASLRLLSLYHSIVKDRLDRQVNSARGLEHTRSSQYSRCFISQIQELRRKVRYYLAWQSSSKDPDRKAQQQKYTSTTTTTGDKG